VYYVIEIFIVVLVMSEAFLICWVPIDAPRITVTSESELFLVLPMAKLC